MFLANANIYYFLHMLCSQRGNLIDMLPQSVCSHLESDLSLGFHCLHQLRRRHHRVITAVKNVASVDFDAEVEKA